VSALVLIAWLLATLDPPWWIWVAFVLYILETCVKFSLLLGKAWRYVEECEKGERR
jgi:hypothetical protein